MKKRFRLAGLASGVWAGLLVGVALVGTPAAFAVVPASVAGKLAGHMLTREAWISIGMCVLLFPVIRQQARHSARALGSSVMSVNVLLLLGALFCTVFGHFGLSASLEAARAGQGHWSFGTLHAVSVATFGLKTLLVLSLAWRFSSTSPVADSALPLSQ